MTNEFASAMTMTLLAESSRRRLASVATAQLVVETSLGEVLLVRSAHGLVGLWFAGQKHHPGALDIPHRPDDELLSRAADQLISHLAGDGAAFDLPLDLQGTPFQRAVWQALLTIPPGATRSYRQIADGVGAASALRAVGGAVGRNPVSVIVPCHRVIGSDGSMTGYAGGLARKRALLALEHAG
jgi:methylated-DNA-[protein]-cysteine S-methyltransferase